MRPRRLAIMGAALAAFAGTAIAAGGGWKTVTLAGGVTIDLPAAVGKDYETTEPNYLFHFSYMAEANARMDCEMSHHPYKGEMTQARAEELFSKSPNTTLCTPVENATGFKVLDSHAVTSNGLTGGVCTSSATMPAEKLQGWTASAMALAAADSYYLLTCGYGTSSQEAVEAKWKARWSARVAHMQQSLRLPK